MRRILGIVGIADVKISLRGKCFLHFLLLRHYICYTYYSQDSVHW